MNKLNLNNYRLEVLETALNLIERAEELRAYKEHLTDLLNLNLSDDDWGTAYHIYTVCDWDEVYKAYLDKARDLEKEEFTWDDFYPRQTRGDLGI